MDGQTARPRKTATASCPKNSRVSPPLLRIGDGCRGSGWRSLTRAAWLFPLLCPLAVPADIHMCLFFVMVLFLVTGLGLVVSLEANESKLRQAEKLVHPQSFDLPEVLHHGEAMCNGKTHAAHHGHQVQVSKTELAFTLKHLAMRWRFISNAGQNGAEPNVHKDVPKCDQTMFDFAEYIAMEQAFMAAEVVEVTLPTWLGLLCFFLLMNGVMRFEDPILRDFIFIAGGYVLLGVGLFLRHWMYSINQHLHVPVNHKFIAAVKAEFCPGNEHEHEHGHGHAGTTGSIQSPETAPLLSQSSSIVEIQPVYQDPDSTSTWMKRVTRLAQRSLKDASEGSGHDAHSSGHHQYVPTKHDFLFGRMLGSFHMGGPEFICYFVRLLLLLNAIYVAVLSIYVAESITTNMPHNGWILVIVAALPAPIVCFWVPGELIALLVVVGRTETMKVGETVREVQRKYRTSQAVRSIRLLANIRMDGDIVVTHEQMQAIKSIVPGDMNLEQKSRYREHKTLFESLDDDHSGTMDHNELRKLIVLHQSRMGTNSTPEQVEAICTCIHELAGTTDVPFADFHAYFEQLELANSDESEEVLQKRLFDVFDSGHDGNIDVEEFKSTLIRVCPDMTETDIMMFIRECDKDQDGEISLPEFKDLLEKYSELS